MAADTPAQSVDEPAAHAGRDLAEPGKKGGPEPGRPGSREPPATGDGETTASDEHASDKNAPAHADGPSESGEPIGGEAPRDQPNQIGNSWDVSGYVPKALARARRKFPDAVLIRIDADGVYPSGQADLTLDEHFSVLYRFMSPSRARRPADLPQGVKHKPTCIYYVLVDHDSISSYALEGWSCEDEHQIPMPRCSAREIWRRAAADGAPTKNAVASLSYRHNTGGKALWWFSIGDRHQLRFEDDCQK